MAREGHAARMDGSADPPVGAGAGAPDLPAGAGGQGSAGSAQPPSSRPPGWPWAVLAGANARRLLGTRLVGQASDGLLQAALGGYVLFSPERQTTAAQVAAGFAVLLLPYSLVGPFAGVLLDRWSRVRVLVGANLVRAGIMLGVAALVARDRDGIDLAVTVLAALGFGRLVLAGLSAGLPHVVPGPFLVTANALFPTAGTVAAAIATVTGLVLIPRLGAQGPTRMVVIVAFGLVLAALIARRIPTADLGPDPGDPGRTQRLTADLAGVVRGMLAGVVHVHQRRAARRAMGMVAAHRFVFGLLLVDALLVVRNTLNDPQQPDAALSDFAMTAAGASAGSFAAAVLTPVAAGFMGVLRWAVATLLLAAGLAPLSFAAMALPLLIVGSALMGFSGQAMKIAGDTVLQREVADDYRGRVFAVYDVVLNVALVAGITTTALVVPASGQSPGVWLASGMILLATAAWGLRPEPRHG